MILGSQLRDVNWHFRCELIAERNLIVPRMGAAGAKAIWMWVRGRLKGRYYQTNPIVANPAWKMLNQKTKNEANLAYYGLGLTVMK